MKVLSLPIPSFKPVGPIEAKGVTFLSFGEAAQIRGGAMVYPPARDPLGTRPSSLRSPLSQRRTKGQIEKEGWSESIHAVLEQPPARLTSYLVGMGLLFSGAFVTWACVGHIQEVSHGQGKLIPQGESYKIQPVIQGQVESIAVSEGDFIEKGQVLVSLDSDLLEADVSRLSQTLAATEQALSQVRSLIGQTQQESVAYRRMAAANTQAAETVLQQSQLSVSANQVLLTSSSDDISVHQERLDRISALEAEGAVSKEYIFGIEQGVRERQQAMTQNESQLLQSVAQTQKAAAELAQKQAEEQQTILASQQTLKKLEMEAQQLEADIADLSTQLTQAQTKRSQSQVRASTGGIVSALDIDNIGEVVQPGQVLAEIVPVDMPLVLSTVVPNREAGLIEVGMTTQVKMDAFPYQTYGIMPGKVLSISPDAQVEAGLVPGYQVDIALDKDFVMHEQQPVSLQMGQTASAEIVVRRRRIIEIVLDPIRRMQESDLSL